MSEKRRDNKGRILKTGESQRKDLTYQYRYKDNDGKRRTVYSPTLHGLREKEKDIQNLLELGLIHSKGSVKVYDLITDSIASRRKIRESTRAQYQCMISNIKDDPFCTLPIKDVKTPTAKQWLVRLADQGYARSTIKVYKSIMRSAFQEACENDYIIKNPFAFTLDFLENDESKREALTLEQQTAFLRFLQADSRARRIYNITIILLETGLRISELFGLTFRDVDLVNNSLTVDHQLIRDKETSFKITPPKSASGIRTIPLTVKAKEAFQNVIANRRTPSREIMIDGRSGFLFLTSTGIPYSRTTVAFLFDTANKRYQADHSKPPLPKVTPHVLRHTFCTNMVNAGMNPKHVQYLMGHSDISITLNRYTHTAFEQAKHEMTALSLIG